MKVSYARQNERGSSLVGAVIVMLFIGYLGSTMTQQNSGATAISTNEIQTSQAFYLAQAGIQTALSRLNNGEFPNGTLNFGGGTATITSNPVAETVTVNGQVGTARKSVVVTVDPKAYNDGTPGSEFRSQTGFAKSCFRFDTSSVYLDGAQLKGLKGLKTCNAKVKLTNVSIAWSFSNCAVDNAHDLDMDDDGIIDADDPVDCSGAGKFLVCHNDNRPHTICVSPNGWLNGHNSGTNAHVSDYLGACPSDNETTSSCPDDAGSQHLLRAYLDDLVGAQDNSDLLFTGDFTSGVSIVAPRNFTQNAEYNFGPTLTNEAIVFTADMGARVTFTVRASFEDGSQTDPVIFVAYRSL